MHKLKQFITKLRQHQFIKKMYKVTFIALGNLPPKKNLIIFESFLGKQYSDNPRAIYEFIKDNCPEYEMYWSVDYRYESRFKEKDLKTVRRLTPKWMYLMARAKYWVSNSRLPLWIPKPKHTTYLQTWHGTPLKRLAADLKEVHMPGTNTEAYKKNFLNEASKWDYLISPNAYSTEIFKRAFQFNGTMIESGYPRNDFLVQNNDLSTMLALKKQLGLPQDKKIILYAPTWRDNLFYEKGKYKFDLELDFQKLQKQFSSDYVVLLRLHYLVAENLDLSSYQGFVYNFSNYEDIRDLYLISDLLITDYSSVFFDFAILKRPVLFFAYDIEDYRNHLRGFYFNLEEAPGPIVKSTEEIVNYITAFEKKGFQYSRKYQDFIEKFAYLEDGCASDRVVKQVFGDKS